MKAAEGFEIDVAIGVTIGNQEGAAANEMLSILDGASCAQGDGFLRDYEVEAQPSICEMGPYRFGEMAGAQDETPESPPAKLANEDFEEGTVVDGRHWLGTVANRLS